MPKLRLIVFFIFYVFPYAMASNPVGNLIDLGFGRRAQAPIPPIAIQLPKYQPLKIDGLLYCPAEGDDREKLEQLLAYNYIMKILFLKNFTQEEEKFCKHGVEAVLHYRKDKNGLVEMWGENDQHPMYFFVFQYWQDRSSVSEVCETVKNTFISPLIKIGFVPIYTIGYDTSINKVVWTRHSFKSLSDDIDTSGSPNVQYQPTNYGARWNTNSFPFEEEYFSKIDRAFQTYNENTKNPEMIKRQLVPEEDMPPMRKKSTHHLINIAPLWESLKSLMEAINIGIRKANHQIQLKFPTSDNATAKTIQRSPKHQLIVYTKLFYLPQTPQEETLRIPYLWLKFVYYEPKNAGILIYIHNTPGQEPQQETKHCEIDEQVCNFTEWADEDSAIENLHYAYCCKPSPSVIRKYFPIKKVRADVENVLDIEKIVNGDTSDLEAPIATLEPEDSSETNHKKRPKQEESNQ